MQARRRFMVGLIAGLVAPGVVRAQEQIDIDKRVAEIFGFHLGVPPDTLKPGDRFFVEMGLDDLLEIGEILTDIEKKFGIDIPVEIASMFENMGNVIHYVRDALAAKGV